MRRGDPPPKREECSCASTNAEGAAGQQPAGAHRPLVAPGMWFSESCGSSFTISDSWRVPACNPLAHLYTALMADTRVQVEVEDWVRREWFPTQVGQPMHRERVRLNAGGVFDFDAVSADHSILAVISTSSCRTSGGNYAVGKLMKIRSDILFLTMASCKRRLVVSTDRGMHDQLVKEHASGRLPREIELLHAELPPQLCALLAKSQQTASEEVRPRGRS